MKEQFRRTRRELIARSAVILSKRSALKGKKGVSEEWANYTKILEVLQDKINGLSSALGLEIRPNHYRPKQHEVSPFFKGNVKPINPTVAQVIEEAKKNPGPEGILKVHLQGLNLPVDHINYPLTQSSVTEE